MRRVSQPRRMALLALLASGRREPVSRDRLLGILWPDRDERSARHLLADSLYVLRQTLGDDAIVAAGESLQLSADLVWTDVVEFRTALAEERWSDALDLYRGDFLDGFFVRNAADFDQWAMAERSRLEGLATRAASALADLFEHAGRFPEAAAAAERTLELSPCDEALFRNLLRLLIAADNPTRADAVALGFVERLALDLGVTPSAETMRLIREARGRRTPEPIVVIAPRPPAIRKDNHAIDSVTASIIAHGRHHWHRRTRSALERAIAYFTRALERDARSVDALCGIADSWIVMGGRGYVPVARAIEHAAVNTERAQALDDASPSVFASIGGLNVLRRRWRDAESALRRAILIDPENADARHWLSLTLLNGFGERERAICEQTIAARLSPVSPIQVGALGWQQYLSGAYDLSRSNMTLVIDLTADLDARGDPLPERASALAVLEDGCRVPAGVTMGGERFWATSHLFWL
jgi:DNA-binding SARP family transcriptional activator